MGDIVRFKGGLGNQMFQYAFMKSLEKRGRDVTASLGYYKEHPEEMQYELDKVFSNLQIKTELNEGFLKGYRKWRLIRNDSEKIEEMKKQAANRFFWNETLEEHGIFQGAVFDTTECVFAGYWQSYKYFEKNRKEILHDFTFGEGEEKLVTIRNKISTSDRYVAVHIRRGDYLQAEDKYGDICTKVYYYKAIEYMKKVINRPIFVFFSDDIDWVRKEMQLESAIYINKSMFDDYQSWYDMSLMSVCRASIIANSSFSWWGAWLKQRPDQIIIGPQKWLNGSQCTDICPNSWLRM